MNSPFPENVVTTIKTRRGGLIDDIYSDVKSVVVSYPHTKKVVIFTAGLCDLTTKLLLLLFLVWDNLKDIYNYQFLAFNNDVVIYMIISVITVLN